MYVPSRAPPLHGEWKPTDETVPAERPALRFRPIRRDDISLYTAGINVYINSCLQASSSNG